MGSQEGDKATPTTKTSDVHTKPTPTFGSSGILAIGPKSRSPDPFDGDNGGRTSGILKTRPESRSPDQFDGDNGGRMLGSHQFDGDNDGRTLGILKTGPEYRSLDLFDGDNGGWMLGSHESVKASATETSRKNGVQTTSTNGSSRMSMECAYDPLFRSTCLGKQSLDPKSGGIGPL